MAVSFVANMGTLAVGAAISMSGILLAQIEESDEGLQLTSEQGSWFGRNFDIFPMTKSPFQNSTIIK